FSRSRIASWASCTSLAKSSKLVAIVAHISASLVTDEAMSPIAVVILDCSGIDCAVTDGVTVGICVPMPPRVSPRVLHGPAAARIAPGSPLGQKSPTKNSTTDHNIGAATPSPNALGIVTDTGAAHGCTGGATDGGGAPTVAVASAA